MTSRIDLPPIDWRDIAGRDAVVVVKVDWLELRLTLDQIAANAIALANDCDPPFPDQSFIEVHVPRPRP